jgi:hypothetical protein
VSLSPAQIATKLSTLSLRDWVGFVQAQWALVLAQITVWRRPIGSLATPTSSAASGAESAHIGEARHIARSILRAARFGVFRPQCLVRSVALSNMLAARGITGAVVRIGVRRKDGEFLAHAWVELGGETIGDVDEHVGTFVPLTNIDVHR